MPSRKVSLIALGAVIIAGGAWFMLGHKSAPILRIETAAIDRGDIVRSIATTGTVSPLVTVEIGTQVSGLVSQLNADFNSPVTAGEVIAVIDPQAFEQKVTQANADLSVAEANIDVQQASILKAQAKLKESSLTLERTKQLRQQGNTSQSTLDTAQADYDSADADVSTAKAQLRTAQATKVQREAALKSAQIDLDHTQIRSPIDGIVTERVVSVGQTVAASFSSPILFNIAQDLTKIQIEASVDEADIGGVNPGDETNFTVDAYPDRHFNGSVAQVRLAPTTEQSVVTYTVIIAADNPDKALLPGMTANVEIITGKSADALRVPNEALRFRAPDIWEAAAKKAPGAGAGGEGGGGRGGFAGGSAAILDQLPFKLTDDQKAGIKKDLAALQPARPAGAPAGGPGGGPAGGPPPGAFGGGGGGGGVDRNAIRQQAQQRVKAVLAHYLTDDQMQEVTKVMDDRAKETTATLWVTAVGGQPERRFVRLGITDNRYTAILGGPLKQGETVVTRASQQTAR